VSLQLDASDFSVMDDAQRLAVLESMIAGMIADNRITPAELRRFDEIVLGLPWGVEPAVLTAMIKGAKDRLLAVTRDQVHDYVSALATKIPTAELRDKVVFTMATLMLADGELGSSRRTLAVRPRNWDHRGARTRSARRCTFRHRHAATATTRRNELMLDLARLVELPGHTQILYGSYARGEATPESDVDIACFADVPETLRDARPFHGTILDGFVYPTAIAVADPLDVDLLKLLGGRILRDERGLALLLLDRLAELDRRGPAPLPDQRSRCAACGPGRCSGIRRDDPEARYRRHWLPTSCSRTTALRDVWYRARRSRSSPSSATIRRRSRRSRPRSRPTPCSLRSTYWSNA
jgi:hypothetical protein